MCTKHAIAEWYVPAILLLTVGDDCQPLKVLHTASQTQMGMCIDYFKCIRWPEASGCMLGAIKPLLRMLPLLDGPRSPRLNFRFDHCAMPCREHVHKEGKGRKVRYYIKSVSEEKPIQSLPR